MDKRSNNLFGSLALCMAVLMSIGIQQAAAQCTAPAKSSFTINRLEPNFNFPSHMALHPDGRVFVFHQWSGDVRLYTPGQGVSNLGSVPTNEGRRVEDGGLGIELDPGFDSTNWIYVFHTTAQMGKHRLSRYTLNNGQIGSPKTILELDRIIAGNEDQRHAGGGISFNNRTGDLYIATGDDTFPFGEGGYGPRGEASQTKARDARRTSANTNDLRGKVLRIRPIAFANNQTPTPGVGTTYEIPDGNLFNEAQDHGDATRPEIYTMGHRNSYRVKADELTGWAYQSEVGPDADANSGTKGPRGYDEINLIKSAGNHGWPYAVADNKAYIGQSWDGWSVGQAFDLNNIQNVSQYNTGLDFLPAARPALVYYNAGGTQPAPMNKLGSGGESAMVGGAYNYDPNSNSSYKFPPFFHRKVAGGDYMRRQLFYLTLDKDGVLQDADIFFGSGDGVNGVIDMEWGADGALYVLEYDNGGYSGGGGDLYRIEYTGQQYSPTACSWVVAGCTDPIARNHNANANMNDGTCDYTPISKRDLPSGYVLHRVLSGVNQLQMEIELPTWAGTLEVYNVNGRLVWKQAVTGESKVQLEKNLQNQGLLFLNIRP